MALETVKLGGFVEENLQTINENFAALERNKAALEDIPDKVSQPGDVCYLFGGKSFSGVNCINPRTGEVLSPVAVNSPLTNSYTLYYHYGAAVYGNTIYSYTRSKAAEGKGRLRRAEFFTQPPEEAAPVVCKIFQGQKYRALRPFTVERLGLEIKKTQQTAQEDIVIKMYGYSAAGGQTIYIEI